MNPKEVCYGMLALIDCLRHFNVLHLNWNIYPFIWCKSYHVGHRLSLLRCPLLFLANSFTGACGWNWVNLITNTLPLCGDVIWCYLKVTLRVQGCANLIVILDMIIYSLGKRQSIPMHNPLFNWKPKCLKLIGKEKLRNILMKAVEMISMELIRAKHGY